MTPEERQARAEELAEYAQVKREEDKEKKAKEKRKEERKVAKVSVFVTSKKTNNVRFREIESHRSDKSFFFACFRPQRERRR